MANLANSSTSQKFGVFGQCEYLPKWPFSEICKTRQTVYRVLARLADIRQTVLQRLARLANIRQAVYRVLARLADIRQHSPKFAKFTKIRQRPFLRKM